MPLRRTLRRFALDVERFFDGLLALKGRRRPPLIEPYIGYATPDTLVARGRVLTHLRRQAPEPEQHWFVNLRQMLSLFLTDEVEGVRLHAGPRAGIGPDAGTDPSADGGPSADDGPGTDRAPSAGTGAAVARAVSDAEGYFTLALPRGARDLVPGGTARSGGTARRDGADDDRGAEDAPIGVARPGDRSWIEIEARIEGSDEGAALPVMVPRRDAALGVISDIDDTLMKTGAYSLARNLWTSLTGNALTRHVFPDAVALVERLSQGGRNPVFYVSSSPWNLHHFLESVFDRAGVVRGPMFLRDIGVAEDPDANSHGGHKGAAIDTLMAANPGLPFWLMGDTGQHDAEIYLDAARRHPGRVVRVALREPGPGPDAAARGAMEALRALGVEVTSARDFRAVVAALPAADAPSAAGAPTAGGAPTAAGAPTAGDDAAEARPAASPGSARSSRAER